MEHTGCILQALIKVSVLQTVLFSDSGTFGKQRSPLTQTFLSLYLLFHWRRGQGGKGEPTVGKGITKGRNVGKKERANPCSTLPNDPTTLLIKENKESESSRKRKNYNL